MWLEIKSKMLPLLSEFSNTPSSIHLHVNCYSTRSIFLPWQLLEIGCCGFVRIFLEPFCWSVLKRTTCRIIVINKRGLSTGLSSWFPEGNWQLIYWMNWMTQNFFLSVLTFRKLGRNLGMISYTLIRLFYKFVSIPAWKRKEDD